MNFLSMKYFLMLAEERSFTKAAERLHITQQTLSAHVAALERETGAKLFVRHVPLELTDSGSVFLRYARLFVRNELALKRELSDVSGRFEGILRIGIAPSRGQVMLPSVIARFQERYPRCGIRLFEMANENIWKGLKRDEIDIAMARLPGEMPGISHRPWMKEEIVLLVEKSLTERLWGKEGSSLFSEKERKKGLPLFFEDCPFLLNSENDIAGALARQLFRRGSFAPRVAVESENMGTMLRLCRLGRGAYFCPENLARALLSEEDWEKLHVMHFEEGVYELSFGWQTGAHRWQMIEKWMEMAGPVSENEAGGCS